MPTHERSIELPYITVNGYSLHYIDDDFSNPWEPPKPAILLNHWGYGDHREYARWVPLLGRKFRVLRLDRRGFGKSEVPPATYRLSLEDIIADFVGFLDALDLETAHYVGDGVAGVFGASLCFAHPDRVTTLTMCGSPVTLQHALVDVLGTPEDIYTDGAWRNAHLRLLGLLEKDDSIENKLITIYERQAEGQIPKHMKAGLRALGSRPDFDLTSILSQISVPTLLLTPTGAKPLITDEQQRWIAEQIPECRQVEIPDTDRGIAFRAPDKCAQEVLRFIDDLSSGRGLR